MVEMFDHAYQNYMVSCLSKIHRLAFRELQQVLFLWKTVAKV